MFWQWYGPGETASRGEGGGSGRFGLYATDPVFQTIRQNAAATKQLYSAPVGRCSRSAAPAPAPCTSSYVGGRPGTG